MSSWRPRSDQPRGRCRRPTATMVDTGRIVVHPAVGGRARKGEGGIPAPPFGPNLQAQQPAQSSGLLPAITVRDRDNPVSVKTPPPVTAIPGLAVRRWALTTLSVRVSAAGGVPTTPPFEIPPP